MIPLTLTLAPVDESAAERERLAARWIGAYRNMRPSQKEAVLDTILERVGVALQVLAVIEQVDERAEIMARGRR